jgi:hypothetical protein
VLLLPPPPPLLLLLLLPRLQPRLPRGWQAPKGTLLLV